MKETIKQDIYRLLKWDKLYNEKKWYFILVEL